VAEFCDGGTIVLIGTIRRLADREISNLDKPEVDGAFPE
jgi:hypothetical protein